MTRIGLMGFGRIGRNLFRQLADHPTLEVAAIVDTAEPEGLTYLLKYDSIYGRFATPVSLSGGNLLMEDRKIPFSNAREPGDFDWSSVGADLVVSAVGKYRTAAWCEKHLERGAGSVVLASTPERLGEIPILLRGVNDEILTVETKIVALGSNTSNALAPVLRILDAAFGLERAMFTTVHAMTNTQRLADVPSEGFRSSRAAGENIIPSETNSAEILAAVLPEFVDKLKGVALNVPVADGSTVDLVAHLREPTSKEAVNAAVAAAAAGRYLGVLEFSTDPIVSSDVRGSSHSGVFDSLATIVMEGTLAKTITWFNNGWGYAARIVEVLERMAERTGAKV